MSAQHTFGHEDCPGCREVIASLPVASMTIAAAGAAWLTTRKRIAASTRDDYHDHLRALAAFFGPLPLAQFEPGHILAYQQRRQQQIRLTKQHAAMRHAEQAAESDGASRINREISTLAQVMRRADLEDLWHRIKRVYEPLPLPVNPPGTIPTAEEERHIFRLARSRKHWMVACCCALISRGTTAGPKELRYLRLADFELDGPQACIRVERDVKNRFRRRPLPLFGDSLWAARWLVERYRAACRKHHLATSPEHFVIFHRAPRAGGEPDFSRPASSWKKALYKLRAEVAKLYPHLADLRHYDWRRLAATEMLENPEVSYATIEHIMGHRLDSDTKRKYDHLRNEALARAATALNRGHVTGRIPPTSEEKRPRFATGT